MQLHMVIWVFTVLTAGLLANHEMGTDDDEFRFNNTLTHENHLHESKKGN